MNYIIKKTAGDVRPVLRKRRRRKIRTPPLVAEHITTLLPPLTKTMLAQNSRLKLQFLLQQPVGLEICIVFCAP
jgi:hypothetical protein